MEVTDTMSRNGNTMIYTIDGKPCTLQEIEMRARAERARYVASLVARLFGRNDAPSGAVAANG